MRALLCIALLALLAAPSLAKPPHGQQWPRPKPSPKPQPPKPFKATGALLADSKGINFGRAPFTWASDDDGFVNIVSNMNAPGMGWQLVGKAVFFDNKDIESLSNVTWAYGALVKIGTTEVKDRAGNFIDSKLEVTLVGDRVVPIRPGKTLNLGPKATIAYKAEKGRPRIVEIVVKPFIKIVITQPWVRPVRRFDKGFYKQILEVAVTLTEMPNGKLTGLLVPELPQQP